MGKHRNDKFKNTLYELPSKGRIGFQNHGQVFWLKEVIIRPLY